METKYKDLYKVYSNFCNEKGKSDISEFEKKVAAAALEEWAILTDTKFAVSAISQVRQIKLFCIIKNILGGIIPSEYDVALIFHCTERQAKTIMESTLSTYSEELRKSLYESIKNYFEGSRLEKISNDDEDDLFVDIGSAYFVKKINEELRLNKPELPLIKKLNDSTSFYKVSKKVVDYFNGEEN
ncbi:hypothetical protein [uncultured Treponema sp.]|uniref:hypothetical protein n=1 Tax=uncultured Treponema sp. TaxID=162155 RepID=UPI0025EEB897|nr:hypothetical protein [uncultured Treponema sp.]